MNTSQQRNGAPTHDGCRPIEDEPDNPQLLSRKFYGCVLLILLRGEYENHPTVIYFGLVFVQSNNG
jgi:hypothetical protein